MKYASLILLVVGLLLTAHGISVIEGAGLDVARFFLSVEMATQILPLGVGIVLMVTSVAGLMPGGQDVRLPSLNKPSHSVESTKPSD